MEQMKNKSTKTTKSAKKTNKIAKKKLVGKPSEPEKKKDFWGGLGNIVRKAVDCCLE